eukprot:gene5760-6056_t
MAGSRANDHCNAKQSYDWDQLRKQQRSCADDHCNAKKSYDWDQLPKQHSTGSEVVLTTTARPIHHLIVGSCADDHCNAKKSYDWDQLPKQHRSCADDHCNPKKSYDWDQLPKQHSTGSDLVLTTTATPRSLMTETNCPSSTIQGSYADDHCNAKESYDWTNCASSTIQGSRADDHCNAKKSYDWTNCASSTIQGSRANDHCNAKKPYDWTNCPSSTVQGSRANDHCNAKKSYDWTNCASSTVQGSCADDHCNAKKSFDWDQLRKQHHTGSRSRANDHCNARKCYDWDQLRKQSRAGKKEIIKRAFKATTSAVGATSGSKRAAPSIVIDADAPGPSAGSGAPAPRAPAPISSVYPQLPPSSHRPQFPAQRQPPASKNKKTANKRQPPASKNKKTANKAPATASDPNSLLSASPLPRKIRRQQTRRLLQLPPSSLRPQFPAQRQAPTSKSKKTANKAPATGCLGLASDPNSLLSARPLPRKKKDGKQGACYSCPPLASVPNSLLSARPLPRKMRRQQTRRLLQRQPPASKNKKTAYKAPATADNKNAVLSPTTAGVIHLGSLTLPVEQPTHTRTMDRVRLLMEQTEQTFSNLGQLNKIPETSLSAALAFLKARGVEVNPLLPACPDEAHMFGDVAPMDTTDPTEATDPTSSLLQADEDTYMDGRCVFDKLKKANAFKGFGPSIAQGSETVMFFR